MGVWIKCMRGSRKFCLRRFFFLDDEGERISVSLPGQRWPNIECWLGCFVIFQAIRTSIAKKNYVLWFFREVPTPCPPSPLWISPLKIKSIIIIIMIIIIIWDWFCEVVFRVFSSFTVAHLFEEEIFNSPLLNNIVYHNYHISFFFRKLDKALRL